MFGSEKYRAWLQHPGMNSGGGGGGSSKTVSEVPAELKPLAAKYSQSGVDLFDSPYQYYDGQRYADMNDVQNQGIDMIQNRALNGSATMNNAEGALNNQFGGINPYLSQYDQFIQGQQNPYTSNIEGFMSPQANPYTSNLEGFMSAQTNPYLDQMFGQAADQVQNRIDSNFALSGRTGSNSHAETFQNGMNDLATNIYGGAYDQDRSRAMSAIGMGMNQANTDMARQMQAVGMGMNQANTDIGNRMNALGTAANFRNADVGNQLQSIGMAPTFDTAYKDAGQMLNAGQILQDQAQSPLDFAYQQFAGEQNKPYNDMAAAAGIFQSQPYGQSSKTTSSGGGK